MNPPVFFYEIRHLVWQTFTFQQQQAAESLQKRKRRFHMGTKSRVGFHSREAFPWLYENQKSIYTFSVSSARNQK